MAPPPKSETLVGFAVYQSEMKKKKPKQKYLPRPVPTKDGKRISSAEFTRLWATDMSTHALAIYLKCSQNFIRYRADKLGLPRKKYIRVRYKPRFVDIEFPYVGEWSPADELPDEDE